MDWSDLHVPTNEKEKVMLRQPAISVYKHSKSIFLNKSFCSKIEDHSFAKVLYSEKNNALVILTSKESIDSKYRRISNHGGSRSVSCSFLHRILKDRLSESKNYLAVKETIQGIGDCYVVYLNNKLTKGDI